MSVESERKVQEALVEARAARERFHSMMVRARANAEEADRIYKDSLRMLEEAEDMVEVLEGVVSYG